MSSHISDFNSHIQSYFVSSTYGNETQIINSLNHLAVVTDQRTFDLSVYGNNVFFVNLHRLMSTGSKKMSLLWAAVSVLETASKCEEIRQALIRNFHYLPTLANLLKEIHSTEQQQRLLALIEKLTHGAQLESYEPYVESLILKLLSVMEQGSGQKDKTELVTLALSILVNLCYGNLPMTYVLTKNISVSGFCKQIKHLGLVTCKMYIILERNDYMKEMDLHYLLKMSFQEVKNILSTKNSFILRHVVDYLHYIRQLKKDSCSKEDQRNAISLEDNFFRDNLKDFLDDIERYTAAQHAEKGPGNTRKRRKVSDEKSLDSSGSSERDDCMDVLFEILACIVDLEPIGEVFRKRIADLALKWIRTKQSCSCAVDLMRVILEKSDENKENQCQQKLIDSCEAVLEDLVSIVHHNSDQVLIISVSKLLTTLVSLQGASNSTLDKAAELFFQHTFGNILSSFKSSQNFDFSLPDGEIEAFLWALHTFHELANVSPTLWFAKMGNLLKQKPVHFLIAKGLTSDNSELTEATLAISSSVDFPRKDVSHMISMLSSSNRKVLGESQQQNTDRSSTRSVPLQMPPPANLSRDLLERMDQTVTHIQDAVSSGTINDATQVQLIEFYDAKIRMEAHLMQDLQVTVEAMSKQIGILMHQNQLLTAEVNRVQRKNLPLALKVSTLQTENRSLEKELTQVKSATASYDKKINQMKLELSDYIKRYNDKNQQWVALTKQIEQHQKRESNYEKENKRLQHELSNMAKTSEDSRRLLRAAEEDRQKITEQKESDRKMYEGKIREREREISKRNDLNHQLEKQLTERDKKLQSQESELKELLAQIAAKNERIEQVEEQLKESENIQKAIYSLMNKSKNKRDD
nr:testis-specific gene 10 protein-like [Aedes albopictus]